MISVTAKTVAVTRKPCFKLAAYPVSLTLKDSNGTLDRRRWSLSKSIALLLSGTPGRSRYGGPPIGPKA